MLYKATVLMGCTDFLKLLLYLTFFCVLCIFYGMPIHIIRDVALTIRSFYKRIMDFVRYRQATRDMNVRYPDATTEEVAREDVCIICREDLRPWSEPPPPQNGQPPQQQANNATAADSIDERSRPKRLPCGHILHFACLRSWLERQQNCPTCRRPVLVPAPVMSAHTPQLQQQLERVQPQHHPALPQPARPPGQADQIRPAGQNALPQQNVFHFGPLRIAFGARPIPQRAQQNDVMPIHNQQSGPPNISTLRRDGNSVVSPATTSARLQQIEQQLIREIEGLRLQQDHLYLVRALQGELTRLRLSQTVSGEAAITSMTEPDRSAFVSDQPQQTSSTEAQLPFNLAIPEGWTVLPLRRLSESDSSIRRQTHSPSQHPPSIDTQLADSAPLQSPDLSGTAVIHRRTSTAGPLNTISSTGSMDGISSTGEQIADPMERGGRYEQVDAPSHRGAEPLRDESSLTLRQTPDWGSDPTIPEPEPAMDGMQSNIGANATIGKTNVPTASDEGVSRDKGKGKAMTVEDTTDDCD